MTMGAVFVLIYWAGLLQGKGHHWRALVAIIIVISLCIWGLK